MSIELTLCFKVCCKLSGCQARSAAQLSFCLKPLNLWPTSLGRFGAQLDVALRHCGVRDGL
jgi:hypothetical protein